MYHRCLERTVMWHSAHTTLYSEQETSSTGPLRYAYCEAFCSTEVYRVSGYKALAPIRGGRQKVSKEFPHNTPNTTQIQKQAIRVNK